MPTDVTPKQTSFIRDLLDRKNLFASSRFFDAVNAMDAEELAVYMDRLRGRAANCTKSEASAWINSLLALPDRVPEQPKPKPQATPYNPNRHVHAGMYRLADGTIVRVYFGQQSGQMLAKKLVNDHGDHWDWEYMGKATRFVPEATPRLTLEEAAKFGQMTGTCAVCARQLDVPESVDRGIGPVCFSRMSGDRDWYTPKQRQRLGL